MGLGSGIRDLGSGKNLFRIPDPGVKKAPDPGSGSATLHITAPYPPMPRTRTATSSEATVSCFSPPSTHLGPFIIHKLPAGKIILFQTVNILLMVIAVFSLSSLSPRIDKKVNPQCNKTLLIKTFLQCK